MIIVLYTSPSILADLIMHEKEIWDALSDLAGCLSVPLKCYFCGSDREEPQVDSIVMTCFSFLCNRRLEVAKHSAELDGKFLNFYVQMQCSKLCNR